MKMTKQKEKRKKRMKKVISLLLSVAMVLSLTAVEVMADDVETVTDDTETVADDLKVMTVDTETAVEEENAVTLDLSQGSIVISTTLRAALSFPPQAIRRTAARRRRSQGTTPLSKPIKPISTRQSA